MTPTERSTRLNLAPFAAEAIGTFWLVFAGTGAIAVDALSGGAIGHVGISLVFGLVVMAMVYAIGATSGAHINPAVTIGFAIAGRFPWRRVGGYIAAQVIGALLASGCVRLLFADAVTLGETLPREGMMWSAVGLEFAMTAILMFVILHVATGSKEVGIMAGAAIGATIGLCALIGGPISGASMNPARSLGPAVLAMRFDFLWIYLAAPLGGAAIAAGLWALTRPRAAYP